MQASTWQRTPARGGRRGDLGHRVHHPVGVRRCAGDDQHGVVVDRRGHRVGVGAEVGADRHQDGLDAEVVRGLVEGGVGGGGQHHPRARDVGAAVARALHRQQDRLGAAGGHRADRAVSGRRGGRRRSRPARSPSAAATGTPSGRARWSRRRRPPPRARPGRSRGRRSRRRRPGCGRRGPAGRRPAGPRAARGGQLTEGSFRVGRHLGGVEGVLAQPPQAEQGQGGRDAPRSRG